MNTFGGFTTVEFSLTRRVSWCFLASCESSDVASVNSVSHPLNLFGRGAANVDLRGLPKPLQD